jgi:anti-sigma B factor antagonist
MGTENEPSVSDVLVVSSRREGSRVVVELAGELDLHGCDRLTTEVERALQDSADIVEVDARNLTFADSAGLRAVLVARAEAGRSGADFHLSEVSPSVGRVIHLAGLGELLRPAE